MAVNPASAKKLRASLEETVVAPLFDELSGAGSRDDALPEVVLRHRRERAYNRLLDALASRGSATVPPELQREIRNLVRDWAEASFMDGLQAVETFEIRCAEEHDLVVARESGDPDRILEALEKEHRNRVKKQFGELELRGIQTTHRVWQKLDEVYVPLHFEPVIEEKFEGIDGEVITLLARHRLGLTDILTKNHVLLVGAPGSGKSTLVSYLATRAATGQLAEDLGWKESPLPFVLTVRALRKMALTPKAIAEHVGCEIALVSRALEQRSMLLLVDGLDEAPEEARTRLVESLQRFAERHPGSRLIVTSRPAGPPGEIEGRLQELNAFRLVDLTGSEVDEYIDKWCLAAERSIRRDLAEAGKEAEKAAKDLKWRLSQSHSVQKIAVNPLLVTILCVVHRFLGRTIPEHRVTLYEKCTDALLYEWDRAKFEEGAAIGYLDAPLKRRLLAGVARKIHQE
ncbi:MAG TPA: NACHT domain-containing protein, partial [Thermoanaerobaculia bacterium]|nr:NACHT domain-containing protein [Thermoanaerobaculia bacterium]